MHLDNEIFSVEIPVNDAEAMEQFQGAMDDYYAEYNHRIEQLGMELNCSMECARDVFYLRTRSRWSETNEKELIRLHSIGNAPNICNWP